VASCALASLIRQIWNWPNRLPPHRRGNPISIAEPGTTIQNVRMDCGVSCQPDRAYGIQSLIFFYVVKKRTNLIASALAQRVGRLEASKQLQRKPSSMKLLASIGHNSGLFSLIFFVLCLLLRLKPLTFFLTTTSDYAIMET